MSYQSQDVDIWDRLEKGVAHVEESQYETDYLYQWILPLCSMATLINGIFGFFIGMIVVRIQDEVPYKMLDADDLPFADLLISLIIGVKLTQVFSTYVKMQGEFYKLTHNNQGIKPADLRKRLVALILTGTSPIPYSEFYSMFSSTVTNNTTCEEKYASYTKLFNHVRMSHNSTLNSGVWWMITFYCDVCVPTAYNDETTFSDYKWVVKYTVRVLFYWLCYGIMKQYEDILRPTNLWLFSIFSRSNRLVREGFLQRLIFFRF